MQTSDPDGDAALLRGIAHFCRRKLQALAAEEGALMRDMAQAAVDIIKHRLRVAAESGCPFPGSPPWQASEMLGSECAAAVVAKQCRLRRVRELLRQTGATGSGVWLFWDTDVCGDLSALGMDCIGNAGQIGSAAWFEAVCRTDLRLLQRGAVPAAARGIWQQQCAWSKPEAGAAMSPAQFAFEAYAAAALAWQSLLDWDLRRYGHDRDPVALAEWADGEARARLCRLQGVLAALRQDSRPALDAFFGSVPASAPVAQAAVTGQEQGHGPCPLVQYAESLVEMVRRVGAYNDHPVPPALEQDVLGSMCLCLLGPPGTGKTRAARRAAGLYYGLGLLLCDSFTELGRADLVGGYVGETEEKTRKALEGCLEGFVLLDEAYALTGQARDGPTTASKGGSDYGPIALAILLQFMTARHAQGRVAIWAAGYRSAMLRHFLGANEGVSSRFPIKLEWPRFTGPQLVAIALRTAQQGLEPHRGTDRCRLQVSAAELAGLVQKFQQRSATARLAEQVGRRIVRRAVVTHGSPVCTDPAATEARTDLSETFTRLLDDPRLAIGTRWLVEAKLAEYAQELDDVAAKLARSCVTAMVRRRAEAVLRGLPLTGPLPEDVTGGGPCEALLGALRARFVRLRHLVAEAANGQRHEQEHFDGPDGVDPEICGQEWQGAAGWVAVAGRSGRQQRAPPPQKTDRTPWAAARCPWLDPGFVETHITKAARALWLAQTGFNTTRPAPRNATVTAGEDTLNSRAQALRRATELICKMAAPPQMGQVSTAAVGDSATAIRIASDLALAEGGPEGWRAVGGYAAELLELVIACGDERCPPACKELLRDELGHLCSVVLMAPSGTGKTEAARAAAGILYGTGALLTDAVIETGRQDFVAPYVGVTEIKTARLLNSALEAVLFIDEAYSLGLSQCAEDYGTVAAACLVQFMTARENKNKVAVWAAGYRAAMKRHFLGLNEGLPSRFPVQLSWPGLTPKQLAAIVIDRVGRRVHPLAVGIILEALHLHDRRVRGNVRTALRLAALVGSCSPASAALGANAVGAAVKQWAAELAGAATGAGAGGGALDRPSRRRLAEQETM